MTRDGRDGAASDLRARAIRLAPFALPAAALAWIACGRVVAKLGHAGATLDDAYIHFQYARAFAELHPMRFHAGDPATSGATSLLWPALLAPFWLLGMRDEAIVWAAWGLSFAALGALAYEAYHLTRRLAGAHAAVGAAAMVFAFSGFAWCAASGMEVVPLAWLVARTARASAEWVEAERAKRTVRARRVMIALAAALPLMRPEGTLFSLLVFATLALHPRVDTARERARALYALAVPVVVPLLFWMTTGSARSSTMQVKLLPGNPYLAGGAVWAPIATNVRTFFSILLDGEAWSQEFLPKGAAPLWIGGLAAIVGLGVQRRCRWRAGAVLLIALGMLVPCAYDTFLWNRLRYLWPFATGWLIGAACAAELAGDILAAVRARWKVMTPIACGAIAGALSLHLDWTLDDVAESASGIDRQQVALGRWAKRELAPSARIGVNDTGAIAYFGERPTFDVVGLTTPGEARYWVGGAGSRLEHYERLLASAPDKLPTHFIVYPEWMACDAVLGEPLREAVVTDATILGGTTMRVYVADYSRLGSGERPWSAPGEPIDALDVADLESEAEHGYELFGASKDDEVARTGAAPDGRVVVDGGRTRRARERFTMKAAPGRALTLVARVSAAEPARARVAVDDAEVGLVDVPADDWTEVRVDLPPTARERVRVEVAPSAPLATFHYWLVPTPPPPPPSAAAP